jgi:hypothetical protein
MVALAGCAPKAQPGILEGMLQIKGNSLNCKIDEQKGLGVRGVGAHLPTCPRQSGYRGRRF